MKTIYDFTIFIVQWLVFATFALVVISLGIAFYEITPDEIFINKFAEVFLRLFNFFDLLYQAWQRGF